MQNNYSNWLFFFEFSLQKRNYVLLLCRQTNDNHILGYGVMVTLQILVLSFQVRILVAQQKRAVNRLLFFVGYTYIPSPTPPFNKGRGLVADIACYSFHEMLAELSNPQFRTLVKEGGFWKVLLNAIKRMLGFEGTYNAELKELDNILSSFLENYNEEAYMEAVESIYQREIFPTTIEEVDAKETDNQGKEVKEYLADALRAAYADRLEQIDKRYDYIADTAKTLH